MGLERSDARPQETGADVVEDDFFQRLPVLLVHAHGEEREHKPDHAQGRRVRPDCRPAEKIKGDSHGPGQRETHQLPPRQVKGNFVLDAAKVFGNRYIGHLSAPFCP